MASTLHHTTGQIHIIMIISVPAIKIINKCNIFAVNPIQVSHGDFMFSYIYQEYR